MNYRFIRMPKEQISIRRQTALIQGNIIKNHQRFINENNSGMHEFDTLSNINEDQFRATQQKLKISQRARNSKLKLHGSLFDKPSTANTSYRIEKRGLFRNEEFSNNLGTPKYQSNVNSNDRQSNNLSSFNKTMNYDDIKNSNLSGSQRLSKRRKQITNQIRTENTSPQIGDGSHRNQQPLNSQNYFGNSVIINDTYQQIQRSLLIDKKILNDLGERLVVPPFKNNKNRNLNVKKPHLLNSKPTIESKQFQINTSRVTYPDSTLETQANTARQLRINDKRKESVDTVIDKDVVKQNSYWHLQSTMELKNKLKDLKSSFNGLPSNQNYEIDLNHLYQTVADEKQEIPFTKDKQSQINHSCFMMEEKNKILEASQKEQHQNFNEKIQDCTNVYRQILRAANDLSGRKDLVKQMSVFWKSLVLLLDILVYREIQQFDQVQVEIKNEITQKIEIIKQDFSTEIEKYKKDIGERDFEIRKLENMIDKYRLDVDHLQGLLKERDYDLQKLQDPYSLMELKCLMGDLQMHIEGVQTVKNQQFREMKNFVNLLDNYEKDYKQKQQLQRLKITLPKRKLKKTTQGTSQLDHQQTSPNQQSNNVIIRVQKQSVTNKYSSNNVTPTKGENSFDSFKQMISEDDELTPTHINKVQYKEQTLDLHDLWQRNLDVLNEQKMCLAQLKELKSQNIAQDDKLLESTVTSYLDKQKAYQHVSSLAQKEKKEQQTQTDKINFPRNSSDQNMSPSKSKTFFKKPTFSPQKSKFGGQSEFIVGVVSERINQLAKKFMNKNPIMEIIKQGIMNTKNNQGGQQQQQQQDTKQMTEQNIIKILDDAMESKVKADLDIEKLTFEERDYQIFSVYLYDSLLMQYGLKTIANKNIIQMNNGLKLFTGTPFGSLIMRILGLQEPFMLKDQVSIVVRSHLFFKEVQSDWVKRMSLKGTDKIPEDTLSNMRNGGECNIFDLIDELRVAFKDDRELNDRILSTLKPDNYKALDQKDKNKVKKFQIEFSILKITTRIAKLGKDLKYIYDTLDKDKSGSLEPNELLFGLKNNFNVILSYDENQALTKYLDEDGSGDVDFSEFVKKINLGELQQKINQYTISKVSFIDLMLKEWDYYLNREKNKIIDLFKEYDDNGDGVLVLDEFETLIKIIEPTIKKKKVLNLFKQTLEKFEENQNEDDALSPDAFCNMVQYNKLGGFGKEFFNEYFRSKAQSNTKVKKSAR
ncbi:UNKNOWN [Stylonychia lemnae]|uniref:EF-hand domain-containing protein n=1 Tax=Stylonychia lemnae TaxID=5949 RepID=A0A078AQ60_STYLE|nr:UNKNOWN [Stylonychia lemnae]|eukprot:CDW83377.1 UNKNOWN [Stylonychia lemnae]